MSSKQKIVDELSQRAAYWQECLEKACELEQGRAYTFNSNSCWGETVGVLRAFNLETVRLEVIASHNTTITPEKTGVFTHATAAYGEHLEEFPRDELPVLVGFPHKGPLFSKVFNGKTRVKFKGE